MKNSSLTSSSYSVTVRIIFSPKGKQLNLYSVTGKYIVVLNKYKTFVLKNESFFRRLASFSIVSTFILLYKYINVLKAIVAKLNSCVVFFFYFLYILFII